MNLDSSPVTAGSNKARYFLTSPSGLLREQEGHTQEVAMGTNGNPRTSDYLAQISDLRVSADRIRYFAGLDLGELVSLPSEREDLVALSIRMEDNFTGLVGSALHLISKDHEKIAPETLEVLCQDLTLGFIERYGTLALCSSSVLRVLWSAQRLKSEKRPTFLRHVGRALAIFVASQRGRSDSDVCKSMSVMAC
jgi:hypothetical protein